MIYHKGKIFVVCVYSIYYRNGNSYSKKVSLLYPKDFPRS